MKKFIVRPAKDTCETIEVSKPGVQALVPAMRVSSKFSSAQLLTTEKVKAMGIEEMRASEHFKDLTDEELLTLMDTVRTFTEIVYSAWARSNHKSQS